MADTNASTQTQAGAATIEISDFDVLINKQFNPQTDTAKREVEGAVRTLAQQALASTPLISNDVLQTIQAMIAEIDKKLSAQINAIMHHPDFQQLESAWRGLHYLVSNSETDEMLKIRVFNVSKKDLHRTLKRYKGAAWDQSPLFKQVYESEYGTIGGEPRAGVRVRLAGTSRSSVTDDSGRFKFDSLPQSALGRRATATDGPPRPGSAPPESAGRRLRGIRHSR